MAYGCLLFWTSLLVFSCGQLDQNNDRPVDTPGAHDNSISYTRNDLHKLKWIEGKWRGTHRTKPFYEIYHFTNDSTLEIISYDWNGKDSGNSSKTSVHWKNGAYYLGTESKWKVTVITDTTIVMIPHYKASNDIVWKYHDSSSWDAILNTPNETAEYHMQSYDPFSPKPLEEE